MAIDYSKSTGRGTVTLTKSVPTVSLTKSTTRSGTLRVNLNWNARPEGGGGLFRRTPAPIDLDLGCLYEFTDGRKGVVQALGDSFTASPKDLGTPVIRLDGDDRSGSSTDGENLFVDLAHTDRIRRILIFAFIYEGAANWAAADGVVTLYPVDGPPVVVRLDEAEQGARTCAIAMLENSGGGLAVRREVNYVHGFQSTLDKAYDWGLTWTPGSK
jgi:tellurite resistance protein TerA